MTKLVEDEIRTLCLDLLDNGWPAYLTTVDVKGYPQTRAMFNLRNKSWFPKLIPIFENHCSDFMLLFGTNMSSTKLEDLKQNPAASAYYCDPSTWRGVMLGGNIENVKGMSLKRNLWQEGWKKYYPEGVEDPDYAVLRIFPKVVKGWNGSSTFRLDIGESR